MFDFLTQNNFLPHRFCINNSIALLILSVISNGLIFLAYFAIPIALGYFSYQRKDLTYRHALWLFAAFILACGSTHLLHVMTYWQPWYWLQAILDAATALISVYTAIYLWPLIPHLLSLPNAEQLLELNRKLENEIIERKAIEASLQQQITFSKTLIDSLPGVFYRLDSKGRLVDWNQTLELLVGAKGMEMAQLNVLDIIAEQDQALVAEKIAEGFAKNYADIQASLKLANGEPRCFYFIGKTLTVDGQVYLLGTGIDVSARNQAEQKLRDLNRDFICLLENTSDFIYFKDKNSRIRFCSQTLAAVTHHQHWQKMVGKHDSEIFPAETAKIYYEEELPVFRDGIPLLNKTDLYYDEAGNKGWVNTNKWPVFAEDGKTVIGIFGISRDVTENKLIENALRESEARLNSLFENMHSGVAIYQASPDGENFFFAGFNHAAEQIDQQHREALIGKNVVEVFPGVVEMGLVEVFKRVWQTGIAEYFPLSFYSDGRITGWRENYVYKLPSGEIVAIYEDITERKQIEQSLRNSEMQFRQLLELLPVPVGYLSQEGRIEYINNRFQQVFGYSYEDVPTVEQWWQKAYPDENYRQWVIGTWNQATQEAVAQNRDVLPIEYKVTCKNGDVLTVEISGISLNGGFLAIFIDLTERKHTEAALQQRNAELQHYFEQPLIGMITATGDKKTIRINQRFCDMVGYSKEEMRVLDWGKLTHPDDMAENQKYLDQAICGQINTYQMEKRYIHKDGHLIYVHLSVLCVRNSQGEPDYFIGMILDITERKLMEQALKQNEIMLKEAQEIAHLGHWVLDIPSNNLYWSDEIYRIFGAQPQEFGATYQAFLDHVHPEDRDFVNQSYTSHLNDKTNYEIEHRVILKDGSIKEVTEKCRTEFNQQGEPLRSMGVVTDITERKKAERTLREKTEALQRSNADLERFAYSVSHDMRQPLRAISGHLQLLARALKGSLDEDNQQNLAFALEGAKRMDAMILSLLEYSRVGRKTESKAWILTRAVLDEAIEFLSPAISDAKAELIITGDWPQVFASYDELSRLCMNLINNALKYREADQAAVVEIDSIVTADVWQVKVRDYGIGINPQHLDRLFQFFSRLQSRTRFEGTGMGLALCRRIVEHHGGKIWAESEGEGKGCCFVFTLPLARRLG